MILRNIFAISLTLTLSGCATWFKTTSIAFKEQTGGSLAAWDSSLSAAVAYPDGALCMQRATTAKNIEASAAAKISDAVLQLTEAGKSLAADKNISGSDLAQISAAVKSTTNSLSTTTERTAFLDFGLFYICQISANGGLTDTQTTQLIQTLLISASTISGPENQTGTTLNTLSSKTLATGDNLVTPKSKSYAD